MRAELGERVGAGEDGERRGHAPIMPRRPTIESPNQLEARAASVRSAQTWLQKQLEARAFNKWSETSKARAKLRLMIRRAQMRYERIALEMLLLNTEWDSNIFEEIMMITLMKMQLKELPFTGLKNLQRMDTLHLAKHLLK